MSMIKYRVHEVAKDFNVTSKVIGQILTDYIAPPKNHMQVLENNELDVIFEYMTQHNQVASLEEVFNVKPKTEPARKPQPQNQNQPQNQRHNAPAQQGRQDKAPAKQDNRQQPQQPARPAAAQEQPRQEKKDKPHTPRQVAEKRVVDTRGGVAVNIEKYNEKFEDMAGDKTGGRNMGRGGTKEKIGNKNKQRQNSQAASAKRRQEERDKMQKLQLEIA